MWSEERLLKDLNEIGVRKGMTLLAHTSLRSVGLIEGGADTLLLAFRKALGTSGTLIVPTFNFDLIDPLDWQYPPTTVEDLERLRKLTPSFDALETPSDRSSVGVFPEIVRQQPDAYRSDHTALSFAAIGPNARFLVEDIPFHYPLGSESPLARLHQLNGSVLLIGVDHRANSSLHLAEIWASVPYIHRVTHIKTGRDQWTEMQGSPECSEGFNRIEPLLRQSRVTHQGYIGNALSQIMQQRPLVSMAVALLKGSGMGLICDRIDCRWCTIARKMTETQSAE